MKYLIISIFLLFIQGISSAQISSKLDLNDLISSVNEFNDRQSLEKLYIQTDKPDYFVGDTLWLKGYLFDAIYFNASPKSGLMYVEITNDSNRLMKRILLPVFNGISFGQIVLDPEEIPQGSYVLRAYTNWMRNFGEDYIFKKQFYIGSIGGSDWLVNYNAQLKMEAGKESIGLNIKFNRLDKVHVALKDLQVMATDGKKTWAKTKLQTDIDGMLKVNLEIPEKVNLNQVSLRLKDLSKNDKHNQLTIPISMNRPEHIDLQFMPEGGDLIGDIPGLVAFKAINEDGKGVDVSGKIYDSKGLEVTTFNSSHRGIGSFYLSPLPAEVYSARINLPNGASKIYTLPPVKTSGISLSVNNPLQLDSCEVLVRATPDLVATGTDYYLIAQSRGAVCFAAFFKLRKNGSRFKIHKKEFFDGVVRITLAGTDKGVLNERIIFSKPPQHLNIQLNTNKMVYRQRDSVVVQIKVSDRNGKPVQGDFAMAVTDDNQVKIDTIHNGSIISRMLLTADLKGNIEDPSYYLQPGADAEKWQKLDQLLLAQGWVGYDWNEGFKPAKNKFLYAAEQSFEVKGIVSNVFNKPVSNIGVNLFSKRPLLVMDTLTDEKGVFSFKGVFPVDTAIFFIQARNKRGKSFNVGIEVEEFTPPVFKPISDRMVPWYVNMDNEKLFAINKQFILKKDVDRITGRNMLKEVAITAKKTIKDSRNLNGPGGADFIVDQQELEKSGKMTLGDLLRNKVVGFTFRTNKKGEAYYTFNNMILHLIIDGLDVKFGQPEDISPYNYFKQFFDYYDAEDIKGIEVMSTGKYYMRYMSEFGEPEDRFGDHAYIEVTTRGGKGPYLKKSVGTYLYKPLAFSLAKKFYAPKYSSGNTADMTDIRSTIHWEPNIVTDENGKATVTFYTADNPGSYSLIIEGADMKGNFGAKSSLIRIEK